MSTKSGRAVIAVLLPPAERAPIIAELRAGGFEPVAAADSYEFAAVLAVHKNIAVAVVDVENEPDGGASVWQLLHEYGRNIPALMVVNAAALDRLDTSSPGHDSDEYLTRPYTAESIRWRIEAMCIRAMAVDDGSGPVLQGNIDPGNWGARGQLIAVFNTKGGVGKTMVATNLAAVLIERQQRVLLVDADVVTGHVSVSFGMDAVPTVVDAWRDELEGGPSLTFDQLASVHVSGLRVLPLTSSPIHTEILEPQRIATALKLARRAVDFVIVDLHPSYSPLNRAVFDCADRILMPVTPDLPAIRAALKLREVAEELGMRDRMALVVNRANTGISVADMEKTLGLPALGQIRSSGLLLIRAANEGRSLVELAPKEKVTADFYALADRLLGVAEREPSRVGLNLFGRTASARA